MFSAWPLNRKRIYNGNLLIGMLESRIAERRISGSNSKPLITVCNHQSCVDDPLIWGGKCNPALHIIHSRPNHEMLTLPYRPAET